MKGLHLYTMFLLSTSNCSARISDIHEAQASRKRRNGLTALECALGKKLASEFDELDDDPFRMRGGGMLQLSEDKKLALAARDIEVGIKEQFRAETLLRDEHEEMCVLSSTCISLIYALQEEVY